MKKSHWWRRSPRDVLALGWLVLVAVAFVAPALIHGTSLGPYDILSQFGLSTNPHVAVHNFVNSDEIEEFIPWQAFAWAQVHAGHLPLWNPHSLLGLPLAFDFQSAPFAPTVALGYLFPLAWAHSATVVARLIIAGTGVYVFARVQRLGVLAALVGATIFELSGGFSVWLGDYPAGVMAWSGWILVGSALIWRGRHRVAAVGVLALGFAFAFLEGEPQIAAVLVGVVGIVALVMVTALWRSGQRRAARAAARDHVLALVAGAALAAPVYLPSLQLVLGSSRSTGPPVSGLPLGDLTHLLFSQYHGVPTSLSTIIGPDNLYVSMLYVGSIALILAASAFALWRARAEVVAFSLAALVLAVLLFASPVLSLFRRVPALAVFRVDLASTSLDLCLAVLAAFGAHALMTGRGQRHVEVWYRAGVAALGVVLATLGTLTALNVSHLAPAQLSLRRGSFLGPVVGLAACALVLLTRARWGSATTPSSRRGGATHRFRRYVGGLELGVLLVVETAILISAGAGNVSSSPQFLPVTAEVTTLQGLVGPSLVGFGTCTPNTFPTTGLVPDVNIAYGVSEFAAYDPIIPRLYHVSYGAATGTSATVIPPVGLFCPEINSLELARLYGVAFVLEPPGTPAPAQMRRVATLAGEGLYAVPDSGRATLTPLSGGPSVVQRSLQPNASTWRIDVHATQASRLELRITNVPGWSAQLDGRPLRLTPWNAVMLQADVPAGRHVVTLRYWPRALSIGLVLAASAILFFLGAFGVALRRARRVRRQARRDSSVV